MQNGTHVFILFSSIYILKLNFQVIEINSFFHNLPFTQEPFPNVKNTESAHEGLAAFSSKIT